MQQYLIFDYTILFSSARTIRIISDALRAETLADLISSQAIGRVVFSSHFVERFCSIVATLVFKRLKYAFNVSMVLLTSSVSVWVIVVWKGNMAAETADTPTLFTVDFGIILVTLITTSKKRVENKQ